MLRPVDGSGEYARHYRDAHKTMDPEWQLRDGFLPHIPCGWPSGSLEDEAARSSSWPHNAATPSIIAVPR